MAVTDDERTYRAVKLRKDEAELLARHTWNVPRSCCPHLDVFHQRWKTSDGRDCRSCSVAGCGCYEEEMADEQQERYRELVAARKHRAWRILLTASAFGGGLGVLLAQWIWRLL